MAAEPATPRPWTPNTVVLGDNLDVMAAMPDGVCDLIYIDPPYWHGWPENERASSKTLDRFIAFMTPRLTHMRRLLAPTGSLYCHLDWHAVHYVKILLDELFGYDNFLNEIIWSYRTGGVAKRWFARDRKSVV